MRALVSEVTTVVGLQETGTECSKKPEENWVRFVQSRGRPQERLHEVLLDERGAGGPATKTDSRYVFLALGDPRNLKT